jgi:REP element-mobilizing transposase RayT/predicted transcriptional regulator
MNRGVNRSNVFVDDDDYELFLKIVCKACRDYQVVLHDYCLMSNHFHLLVETKMENLSLFMKHVNSNYAIYANKKQKRSGHFWQGRFYSRYVVNDTYYYTLIRYIEQNPIEAGLVSMVGEYPYTLGSVIANRQTPVPCTKNSKLLAELDYENIQEMIGVSLDEDATKQLEEIQKQKSVVRDGVNKTVNVKTIEEHFKSVERNDGIKDAFDDGYTQAKIAAYLNVSRSLISKLLKGRYSTPDP